MEVRNEKEKSITDTENLERLRWLWMSNYEAFKLNNFDG